MLILFFLVFFWLKVKEIDMIDKYFDIVTEQRKLQPMKGTLIKIVVGAFGLIPKHLEKIWQVKNRRRIDTIALLESTRIFRKVLNTWGDLLSSRHQ